MLRRQNIFCILFIFLLMISTFSSVYQAKAVTYNVTIAGISNGADTAGARISIDGVNYRVGETIPLAAGSHSCAAVTPANWGWLDWLVTINLQLSNPSSSSTTLTVNGNGVVAADFGPIITYYTSPPTGTITVNYWGGSPSFTETFSNGQSGIFKLYAANIIANPITGYTFSSWSNTGTMNIGSLTSSTTSFNPQTSGTVTATYAQQTYPVTISMDSSADAAGCRTVIDGTSYRVNQQVTLSAGVHTVGVVTPSGWTWTGWFTTSNIVVANPSSSSTTITVNGAGTFGGVFAQQTYSLTVSAIGTGCSVTKTPDQATYTSGSVVTLTPVAASGWTFSGWSGDLSGSANPATVTMNSNKVITATFTQAQYSLSVYVVGGGSVSKSPDQSSYASGSIVTLTATPSSGWSFSGWSGNFSGSANPAQITMNNPKVVIATFTQNPIYYSLSVTVVGTGCSVTKNPNSATYLSGTIINLTPVAASGWVFSGWSGDLSGNANPATITMTTDKVVTATFTQNPIYYSLTVNVVGYGSVTKSPSLATYTSGTTVTLTPNGVSGWSFSGWSGDLTGSANPATVTMTSNKVITATFTEVQYQLTVVSAHGSPNPVVGSQNYAVGSGITCSVLPSVIEGGIIYTCTGWTGTGSVPSSGTDCWITFTFTQTSSITWNWRVVSTNGDLFTLPAGALDINRQVINRARLSSVSSGQTITVSPGQSFSVNYGYQLWEGSNPSEIDQLLFICSWTSSWPPTSDYYRGIYSSIPPNYPGDSGTGSATFVAPSTPGTYYIWFCFEANYGFEQAANSFTNSLAGYPAAVKVIVNAPQDQYSLTVNVVGTGCSVTKSPSQTSYVSGSVVTLTPVAASGWAFSGWSGDLSGNANPATVTMTSNKVITATFTQILVDYSLTVNVIGTGCSVTKTPNQATYTSGTVVTLTPVAASGWTFSGWSGDVSGSANPTTVTMTSSKVITATFIQNPISYSLTVNVVGTGCSVTKSPNQASYTSGTTVTLTPVASSGWTFSGWSGDLSGNANPATITMTSNKIITATFTQNPIYYSLTTNVVGTGCSVTKTPNQATYTSGTVVTLTPVAASGWTFNGWSGDLSGNSNPSTITMTSNKVVTATFSQIQYSLIINTNGQGAVSKNPDQSSYNSGSSVTLTATASTSWTFSGWSGDLSGSNNPTTVTMNNVKVITATFTQTNQKPIAILSASPEVSNLGNNVDFSGLSSYDPEGARVASYYFDFGDGKTSGWVNYPTVGATHVYSNPGTYYATLKVKDNLGLESDWSATKLITVLGTPKSPTGILVVTPLTQSVNQQVKFDASGSTDTDGTITSYGFDYGDGSSISWSTNPITYHSYNIAGTFTSRVKVVDNSGLESWSSTTIVTIKSAKAATPIINPPTGGYTETQIIKITSADGIQATIKYTTDGTTPTSSSKTYIDPWIQDTSITVRAIAFINGKEQSEVALAVITIGGLPKVSTPNITPKTNDYTSSITVNIDCYTTGAQIRYTTDGTTPTTSSTLYTGPFVISSTQTIMAKAFKMGMDSSEVTSEAYRFGSNPPSSSTDMKFNIMQNSINYQVVFSVPSSIYTSADAQWLVQWYPNIGQNTLKSVNYLIHYFQNPSSYPILKTSCFQNGLEITNNELKNQLVYSLFMYCYELQIAVNPTNINEYELNAQLYGQYYEEMKPKVLASDALSTITNTLFIIQPLFDILETKIGSLESEKVHDTTELIMNIYALASNLNAVYGSQKADQIVSKLILNNLVTSKDYSAMELYYSISNNPQKAAQVISEIQYSVFNIQLSSTAESIVLSFLNEMKDEALSIDTYLPAVALSLHAYFRYQLPASWAIGAGTHSLVSGLAPALIKNIIPLALATAINEAYVQPMAQMLHMSWEAVWNTGVDYLNLYTIGTSIANPTSDIFDSSKAQTFAIIYGCVNLDDYEYNMNMYLYKSRTILASSSETAQHLSFAKSDLAAANQWVSELNNLQVNAKNAVKSSGLTIGVSNNEESRKSGTLLLKNGNPVLSTIFVQSSNIRSIDNIINSTEELFLPTLKKDNVLSTPCNGNGFALLTNTTSDVTLRSGDQIFQVQNGKWFSNYTCALYTDDSFGKSYLMIFDPPSGGYVVESKESINMDIVSFGIANDTVTTQKEANTNTQKLEFSINTNSEPNGSPIPNQNKPVFSWSSNESISINSALIISIAIIIAAPMCIIAAIFLSKSKKKHQK
jgi:uncharacterized repeat protein (TIGR02543 family)